MINNKYILLCNVSGKFWISDDIKCLENKILKKLDLGAEMDDFEIYDLKDSQRLELNDY